MGAGPALQVLTAGHRLQAHGLGHHPLRAASEQEGGPCAGTQRWLTGPCAQERCKREEAGGQRGNQRQELWLGRRLDDTPHI